MLTIITPATSKALTTLSAVKAELGEVGNDELLRDLILRASAMVESACGRSFGTERIRETLHNHRHGGPVLPTRWPVTSVVSLTVDGQEGDPAEVDFIAGMFLRPGGWGREAVVVYDAGFVLPGDAGRTLPYDIEGVVVGLVREEWFARARDPHLRSSNVEGLGSRSYVDPANRPDLVGALWPYRQPVAL